MPPPEPSTAFAPEAVAWRAAILRQRLPATGAVTIRQTMVREGPFALDACLSCGDATPEPPASHSWRCAACIDALALVAAERAAARPPVREPEESAEDAADAAFLASLGTPEGPAAPLDLCLDLGDLGDLE